MSLLIIRKFGLKKASSDLKGNFKKLSNEGFEKIFNQIDQLGIKKGVDQMGIDKFVNQCALLAAGSGVITGAGGLTTMLIGVPLDMVNLIIQQFRVTMAVSYHQTGTYKLKFDDFFNIVAASLKVDAGITITKNMMEEVAEKLLVNIGSKTAERLIPVVGAVIGGSANYLFIKRVAASLKKAPAAAI
ncbi:hypothetical protein BEL04_02765 [Mucilaginibacter sp. PPCGB 2223]|uniref:hypothetical protein n=1 Tax=Mucilaginibacter sp. PPCGB 2223 TaxID=1886027 RepID=UPI0008255A4C|nr:hypothetical protein [Mucilaginibacter sp. PPCGB 2223]OCX53245.1 hypothetical protein BEL04_02765 [Mucilaginibacter sp. PPCGB 2223]